MTKFSPPFFQIIPFGDRFIVMGALNNEQVKTLCESGQYHVQSKIHLDESMSLVVGLMGREQLDELYRIFEGRSRRWRGQYQALAKAIVDAYEATRGRTR